MRPDHHTQLLIQYPQRHVRQCKITDVRLGEITDDYHVFYSKDSRWWELQQNAESVEVPIKGPSSRLMALALAPEAFQFDIRQAHEVNFPIYLNANGMIVRAFPTYEYM